MFDKNGRKLSKWVENTVGKGEIARYEQFLLFPQCFQKAGFPGVSKGVIVWEWDYTASGDKSNVVQMMISGFERVENILGNRESMGECNTILSAYTKYRHLG